MKYLLSALALLSTAIPSDDAAAAVPHIPYHRLDGVIDEDVAKETIEFLQGATEQHAKAAVLEINSPGGRVSDGFEIARAIESAPMAVVCVVDGEADSMAFYILQSCDTRLMTARSTLMTHEPVAILSGRFTANELKGLADEMEASSRAFAEHCRRRLTISEGEYKKRTAGGASWHMAWREATQTHAVDQVVLSSRAVLQRIAAMVGP